MLFLNVFRNLKVQRSMMSYYAVARGHRVGIYENWAQCEEQVRGFKGAKYKKFPTRTEAVSFIRTVVADFDKMDDKKLYWPQDNVGHTETETISDAELLAAATAVEDDASSQKDSASKKRKAGTTSSSSSSKVIKHESKVWEPVGHRIVEGIKFQVDVEGYVIVYTDGSCINNGREGACAGLGVYFSENHPLNVGKPVQGRVTNNVGEIQAAIHAIKIAKEVGIEKLCISTDSQFLINAITQWIHGWKENNWRLKNGEPVKNLVDFRELDELLADRSLQIKWNYVKGHKGIKGNVMADKLAREGSDLHRRIHKR